MAGNLDHHNNRKNVEIIEGIKYIWDLDLTCWSMSNETIEKIKTMSEPINPTDTLIFTYGSFDIRNSLPYYKNTEDVVNKYYNIIVETFSKYGCSIYFMDPVPPPPSSSDIYINQIETYRLFSSTLDSLTSKRINFNSIFSNGFKNKYFIDQMHLNVESNKKIIFYLKYNLENLNINMIG
jgi:hypothetical protein